MMTGDRQQLFQGVKRGFPVAVGYFPIAIAFGALAVEAHLTWFEAVFMSVIVFAGASQFMAAGMIIAGAGALQIITATFLVNLRHLIMSMAVNHRFQQFPWPWKTILSLGITDETFALITLQNEGESPEPTPRGTAAMMTTAYSGWVSGTLLGSLSAGFIPGEITTSMTVGLYALFIGLLVPHVRKSWKAAGVALLAMGLNTGFSLVMDSGWAIVLATVLAAGSGILINGDQP